MRGPSSEIKGFRVSYGLGYEYGHYRNSTYRRIYSGAPQDTEIDYNTNLKIGKFSAFGQVSRSFLTSRLNLSFGIRTDATTYSSEMLNPLHQLSPRLSGSYSLTDKLSLNASTGRYYQLPPYTALGFSTPAGELVNEENLKYMAADHYVAGLELVPAENIQIHH